MDSVGLAQLTTGLERYRNIQSLTVAGMVIVIFDWLLTFEMEVSHIWQAPWNVKKVLYILSRYVPFVAIAIAVMIFFVSGEVVPVKTCRSLFLCAAVLFYIGEAIADLIFTLRTWVVCGRNKKLGIGLVVFYVATWCVVILVPFGLYVRSVVYAPSLVPRLVGCTGQGRSTLFSASFAGAMVFNIVMLLLMATRAISSQRLGTSSGLTKVVYHDGIIYYVYAFVFSSLTFFMLLKLPEDYANLLLAIDEALYSVLSCRVILHIRQQRQQVAETDPRNGCQL